MCAACDQRAEAEDREAIASAYAEDCRRKIAAWNYQQMGDQFSWDKHGRDVYYLVNDMADRIDTLTRAAKLVETFAWSSLKPDCRESGDEANRRIGVLRAALRGEICPDCDGTGIPKNEPFPTCRTCGGSGV